MPMSLGAAPGERFSGGNMNAHTSGLRRFRFTMRRTAMALLATATLALASTTVAPGFAADKGEVYVVQGLPGEVVDVSIDGRSVAKSVRTADVVGPFSVSAGERTVTVSSDGKTLLQRKIKVRASASSDVVVHLPAQNTGDATITDYPNESWSVPKDKAALVVAHTAAVPAADIQVNQKVLFANISNGESLSLVVPVATYRVAIVPTGKNRPFYFGPVDLTVKGGALNRVYAFGDPSKKTMNVAVHVLTAAQMGSDKPSKVDTGTGGQAAGESVGHYYNLLR
jgi:hypothetical protein